MYGGIRGKSAAKYANERPSNTTPSQKRVCDRVIHMKTSNSHTHTIRRTQIHQCTNVYSDILTDIHSLTHKVLRTHIHTHALSLSHSHTHTRSLSLIHTHTLFYSHTHSLSVSLTRTHTLSHSRHTHTLSLTLSLSVIHTHSLRFSLSRTHRHTYIHTHSVSLAHADIHTYTHTDGWTDPHRTSHGQCCVSALMDAHTSRCRATMRHSRRFKTSKWSPTVSRPFPSYPTSREMGDSRDLPL